MNFGEYIKARRLARKWKLRVFARQIGYDPGNWYRVEKGIYPAPKDLKKLELIIKKLKITDLDEFWRLAAATYMPKKWGM